MGQGLPGPGRPLLGRPKLRGTRDLADHHHQQGHRQGHRQAGHVHRGQSPFGRGHGGRGRPVDGPSRPDPVRQGPRDHRSRRHPGPLRPGQEQSRRVGALPEHGPVAPQHRPSVRRRPRQPAGRGPGRGPRRRRLHPAGPPEGRAGQGHHDHRPGRQDGPGHDPGDRRQGRLHRPERRPGQRRRRPHQRGRHRRPGPAPQLSRELAAHARPRPDRPRLDTGRRGRVSPVRGRDAVRRPVPPAAPQHLGRPDHGHDRTDAAARAVHEQDGRGHVPGGLEDLSVLRRGGQEADRILPGRRHLLRLRHGRRPRRHDGRRQAGRCSRRGARAPARFAPLRPFARFRIPVLRRGLVRGRAAGTAAGCRTTTATAG